ncbi:uncharacterized protein LOC141641568 [Silene latifolia]|uniref:uncharacterized protein LOC141641568 n=1 Tax=Silene latifolia TaxID=37657 RepID=UPI003D775578
MARSKKIPKNHHKNTQNSTQKNQKHDVNGLQSINKGKSHHRQLQFSSQEFEFDLEEILVEEEVHEDTAVEDIIEDAPLVQVTQADVAGEVNLWSTSVYCFVLGANPPSSVLTGFAKKVWQGHGIDKISFLPNDIFLVRFKTKAQQQFVLNNGHLLFDNKPVIVNEWKPETELIKHGVKKIPIRMKLFGFARIMVEVEIGQQFPNVIKFLDENGKTQTLKVRYDWLPLSCTTCKGMGHLAEQCRKGTEKKVVRPIQKDHMQQAVQSIPTAEVTLTPVLVQKTLVIGSSLPRRFITKLMRTDNGDRRTFSYNGLSVMEYLSQSLHKSRLGISGSRRVEKGESKTKIKTKNWNKVRINLCEDWAICTNTSLHKGGRIWHIWDPNSFDVDICDVTVQSIHAKVYDKSRKKLFWLTVVYGLNHAHERTELWDSLRVYHSKVSGPWLVGGDFNAVMARDERIGGAPVSNAEIQPMLQAIQDCNLVDLSARGSFFTWSNKHENDTKVYSRIDRVFSIAEWTDIFPDGYVHFLPESTFDHYPCLIHLEVKHQRRGTTFKYFNMWSMAPGYSDIVRTGWQKECQGTPMYKVVTKLRGLKAALKNLNKEQFDNIENLTHMAEIALQKFQELLILDPLNERLCQN